MVKEFIKSKVELVGMIGNEKYEEELEILKKLEE